MAEKDNQKKTGSSPVSPLNCTMQSQPGQKMIFVHVNGQIEYPLTECVRQRKKNGKYVSEHLDEPIDLDISSPPKTADMNADSIQHLPPVSPSFYSL